MTTSELDNLAAETAAYMNIDHPDYAKLAARVSVSNLHKASCSRGTHRQTGLGLCQGQSAPWHADGGGAACCQMTSPSFSETMKLLYDYVDPMTGQAAGFISEVGRRLPA